MRRVALTLLVLFAGACSNTGARIPVDELRPVPSITGQSVEDARAVLESEGFTVQVVPDGASPDPNDLDGSPPGVCADGTVTEQDPGDDEEVLRAATVTVYASGCPSR